MTTDVSPSVVLVVEDELMLRMRAVDIVQDAGFESVEAINADEAIAILEARDDISCLFTDIQMPGMTGDALYTRLLAEGRAIPAVFMTAFPQEAVRARVLAAGATAFLEKPVDCDEIAALVAAAVAGRGGPQTKV